YVLVGKFEEAIVLYHKAIELESNQVEYVSMLGWCYVRTNHLNEAGQYLDKAIELGRCDGWIYSVVGELYKKQNKLSKALEAYQKALKLNYNVVEMKKEMQQIKSKIK
ncbi:MAG: tetratricopeptide repeat protein, partial [Longicatena sp.]